MSQIVHCGKGCSWRQSGNLTGHCSGCHRTFDGERAFDKHQTVPDGRVACHDPAGMVHEGVRVGEPIYKSRTDDLGTTYWSVNPSQAEAERWVAVVAERRRGAATSAQAGPQVPIVGSAESDAADGGGAP